MYQVESSKTVYKSRWMTIYEDSVINKENGIPGIFNRVNVDDAAIIVPELQDGSLLMVENYRHGIRANLLELPGGLVEDEKERPPYGTARRELFEETGYSCDDLEYINWFYTWPGRTTQRNFVFFARGLRKVTQNSVQNHLDCFEYIQLHKISKEEALQKVKNGNIRSAITTSALLYAYFI